MTITGISQTGGGNVSVVNTGALTTSGAISTGANGAINLTATGIETIDSAVTAGGTGGVALAGVGVTISNTVTGPGGLTVNAGTGELTNTATTGVLTNGSDAAFITLIGDTMALDGTVTGGSGHVILTSSTESIAITLGAGDTGLGLSNAELNKLARLGH